MAVFNDFLNTNRKIDLHGSVTLEQENVHVTGTQVEVGIMMMACVDSLLDSGLPEDKVVECVAAAVQMHYDQNENRRMN